MGLGVQSGWSDPTNPTYVPSGSDFLKIYNDIKRLAVRPAGRWLRYDTNLTPDNTWYNCRVYQASYDVDGEAGQIVGPISGTADTFNAITTGIWALGVRERYSGLANGDHSLRITIAGGGSILAESDRVVVPLHVSSNWCYTEHYLTAGQQIQFQHKFNAYGDVNNLTLYTNIPGPEIIMRLIQERDLHA